MRNYPIGSFLFWELKSKKAYDYVFYNFLKHYDQRTPNNKRKRGNFLHPEIIGVLDGQQRLSSLYLGIQGTHRERLKHHRTTSGHAYPEATLHLNLLSLPYYETEIERNRILDIDREKDFEFRFLTNEEATAITRKNEDNLHEPCFWFKIGEVIRWSDDPEIDDIYDNIANKVDGEEEIYSALKNNKRFIKKALRDLHKRLTQEELINYFKITKDDLDDILKIFIRVNSGGTILSKTDLLFSTIIATWEDGRDEIEAFLKDLNEKGDGFFFNNDFLMRSCLVLSDLDVLFKVNSFKSKNVDLIKENWPQIKNALNKTVDLIASFGFSGSTLTSQNAIIIIAYHFMKGGDSREESKQAIRKYLLHALLKNVYGGQGDQVISNLRTTLRNTENKNSNNYTLANSSFSFDNLLESNLPANKTLKITDENIEEFMSYKKGANAFFVLSLLYPNLRYNEVSFHQDHIHPDSRFTNAKLNTIDIPEDKWQNWQQIKDTVPNLQLMEGHQNSSKNATPFKEWLRGNDGNGKKNVADIEKFFSDNFIPTDVDLEINSFDSFYSKRKKLIAGELFEALNIKKHDE